MGCFVNLMPFIKSKKDSTLGCLAFLNCLDRNSGCHTTNRNNHHLVHHNITPTADFTFFIFHLTQFFQNYSSY